MGKYRFFGHKAQLRGQTAHVQRGGFKGENSQGRYTSINRFFGLLLNF